MIRGYDYQIVQNQDGTNTWTGGLEPYLQDQNNNWVPFIQVNNTVIDTAHGKIKLNSDGSYTISKNNMIITDKIVAKYADVSNLNSWTYPNTLNNDVPDNMWNGSSFVSAKTKSAVGNLNYIMSNNNGKWKTQLEATNLSALTTKAFGFDEIVDINSDTISFGDGIKNLDNFNGTTFDQDWIIQHQSKIINFMSGFYFDFDKGIDDLYSITVYDTGVNSSRLVFDYRTSTPLLPNNTLIIDPTYGYNAGTTKTVISDCAGSAIGSDTSGSIGPNAGFTQCYYSSYYFDISTIVGASSVTSVTFRSDTTATNSADLQCYVKSIEGNISTMTNQQILDDIQDGTTFTTLTTQCQTVANNYTFSTASMATDLYNELGVDTEWGLGISSTNYGVFKYAVIENPELQVVYTTGSQPNPVTGITYANLAPSSVDILWTAPNSFGDGAFQNYTGNYTTPLGNPTTSLGNTTSLFFNVTGLTFGTDYSFRVSAVTQFGYNTTFATILNLTTTANSYVGPPTSLTATSGLPTVINLSWTAATINNIVGYKIERETPIDTGWVTLVGNTTTTATTYNDSTVTTQVKYNYRVSAINGTGLSDVSNEADSYAYHIPDAVTTLAGSATDFSTVDLDWTEPTLYADLIGYRINYSTPSGNPLSIVLPNPYTTGTSASIFDLIPGNNYSFRVAPVTIFGANASGNIVNTTTSTILTPGDLSTGDITNTEDFQIFFNRDDLNASAIQVDVTYADTYDLSCDLAYQLANTNRTYSNLTETVVSADEVESSFLFINATGDIVHIRCWDTITGDEAMYVLTITDFPFLQQIQNLRNGTYGTYFQIGAIDGVTLMICILAMIGFNRTNPMAGIVFLVIAVGTLSFFNIITYPIIMYPALALLMVWAFISTRKDD